MIKEEGRYFATEGDIVPGGPRIWYVLDWDQRRIIAVKMDKKREEEGQEEEWLDDDEDIAISHLRKHMDTLSPDVCQIHVSNEGDLISVSTDLKDDKTYSIFYPTLPQTQPPSTIQTILRSELTELDRISPNVDLVFYASSSKATSLTTATEKKMIFKYYFLFQFMHHLWNEMNIMMRLPQHPNIVPFDRLVLDEVQGHVVGFTSLYISGGTVYENVSRVFKLKWLQQLTRVVDDLNFRFGIMHQDIAARNLLVDAETDALMLFDFNYSGRIGDLWYVPTREDVQGVIFTVYEIITRDLHFRDVPHENQNANDVQNLDEWIKHPDVKLDHSVSVFRSVLNQWLKTRREKGQITRYTEAPEYIDWPAFPEPPLKRRTFPSLDGTSTTVEMPSLTVYRANLAEGDVFLNWKRPLQSTLGKGVRVHANGKPVGSSTNREN